MITTAILNVVFFFLNFLVNLIPVGGSFPSEFTSALSFFIAQAVLWDKFIPVLTIFTILGLVFTFEAGIFAFRSIDWVYTKFRGGSHASGAK